MALALISILASIAATAASLATLLISYWLILHQSVGAEELKWDWVFSFVPSLLMCGILYTPALHGLRTRRGESRPAKLFALVSAVLLRRLPAFRYSGMVLQREVSSEQERRGTLL